MLTTSPKDTPISDYDPYDDAALLDPWPGYEVLRELGTVWLNKHNMYALTRFDSVQKTMMNDSVFLSSLGVMMNEEMNQVLRGNTLCSDGDMHTALRRVVIKPLTQVALKALYGDVEEQTRNLVGHLLEKGRINAVEDLATYLPLVIVSNAVGLPEEGREKMLEWSAGLFNCMGPMNERTRSSLPVLKDMMEYTTLQAVKGKLKPGSWAEAICDAADRGEVPKEAVPVLMVDYIGPSLESTVNGISSAVWLFSKNPDQWDLMREDPSLVRNAVNEVLRIEAPLQGDSRYVATTTDIDGVRVPAESRVICFWGAANRDPRTFENPDQFDITRKNANVHLSFGAGPHQCIGSNLARLEMAALFTELTKRVKRIHLEEEERSMNHIARGFKKLTVTLEAS